MSSPVKAVPPYPSLNASSSVFVVLPSVASASLSGFHFLKWSRICSRILILSSAFVLLARLASFPLTSSIWGITQSSCVTACFANFASSALAPSHLVSSSEVNNDINVVSSVIFGNTPNIPIRVGRETSGF